MTGATGRRAAAPTATRRFTPLLLAAVLVPLLALGLLALVRDTPPPTTAAAPKSAPLGRADLVCPAARDGAEEIRVASAVGASGDVEVREAEGTTRSLSVGAESARLTAGPVVHLAATGDLAPGLLASRTGDRAATPCTAPAFDVWFTGVGARPAHRSVVELVNPDAGPAVVDVTVSSAGGTLDVPTLRGIRIAGHETRSLDMAALVPRRTDLALHLVVQRGRLTSSVWETVDELQQGRSPGGWLPAQAEPQTDNYLLGLGEDADASSRKLVIANPGDDEARVSLRVVTKQSEFAPSGVEDLRLDPGSVRTIEVGSLLQGRTVKGATGLVLHSTKPVTAGLRSVVGRDLVTLVGAGPVERAGAALPRGRATVVIAGADSVGTASVATDVGEPDEVEVGPQRSVTVPLPRAATYADITLTGTTARVAVRIEGPGGVTVWPLAPLVTEALVPQVRPALP